MFVIVLGCISEFCASVVPLIMSIGWSESI